LFAVWKPVTYFVVFDDQSATTRVSPDSMAVAYPDTCLKTLPSAPAKTGHIFNGWYTSKNGNGSSFTATTRVSGNMTVFANWLPYTKVIYNGNGSTSGTVPSDTGKYLNGAVAKVKSNSNLVKTGYTFANWNTAKDGTGKFYAANDEIDVGKDSVVLYATWRATVFFDGQEANTPPDPESVSIYYPSTKLKSLPKEPLRAGHTFKGWYTEASGGTEFTAATDVTANDTVFARWAIESYTISYDGNGSTDGIVPLASTHTYNTSVTAASPGTLVRTGYKFTRWNTAESGKGEYVAPGETILVMSDMTLWAQWVPIESFTITFDKNSATATGDMIPQSIESGTSAALTLNAYKYTGYSFSGWATSADGKVEYTDGDDYAMGISDDTLYAVWTPNASHEVTFDKNSSTAEGTMTAQSIVEGVSAALSMNAYTNPGYSFSGWATTEDGAIAYANGANYTMGSSDETLYAIWTALPLCTLSYNGNGNSNGDAPLSTTHIQGESVTLSAAGTLERFGYTFAGWNTSAEGDGTAYDEGASVTMTANLTLFAKWNVAPSLTVIYKGNGSTSGNPPVDNGVYTSGQSATVLGAGSLLRAGYEFVEWNTDENGIGDTYNVDSKLTITSNVTLYAIWAQNPSYTITFDKNDASADGEMAEQSIIQGLSEPLYKNEFINSGYTFLGWSTTPDEDVEFKDRESYTMGSEGVTLYAVWEIDPLEP